MIDLLAALRTHCAVVHVFDPCVSPADGASHGLIDAPAQGAYDAVVIAVAHDCFRNLGPAGIRAFGKPGCVIFDVKSLLPAAAVDERL